MIHSSTLYFLQFASAVLLLLQLLLKPASPADDTYVHIDMKCPDGSIVAESEAQTKSFVLHTIHTYYILILTMGSLDGELLLTFVDNTLLSITHFCRNI
jgi:hypothetical protein